MAARARLVGCRRVLDSAPVYDAVATQDTITLMRSAVCGPLRAADHVLRAVISSGDVYTSAAKPAIDWMNAAERRPSLIRGPVTGMRCWVHPRTA